MKLKVLGAAGTVTGSSYVLTSQAGNSILIDLGMFQGPAETEELNRQPIDYDLSELSGVLVTHAHLDHCGRLPLLVQQGFAGEIWMTPATLELVELVLTDSAKIAKFDPETALYDQDQVEQTLKLCRTHDYQTSFNLADFQVTLHDAGHLLGSAILEIVDPTATDQSRKIIFSGDLGNYPAPVLRETEKINSADIVVMESTYGDRLHDKQDPLEELQAEINAVESAGSTLLIPSFAMEKTQELLYMIKCLKRDKRIKTDTPVYLDSPMAQKATEIYRSFPQLFNDQLQKEAKQGDPFDFPGLEVIFKHKASQAIQQQSGAKVIIAGGGMMTGGRIMGHAKFYLKNPANRIFFVGYQGEETLGREILEGNSPVEIDDLPVHVTASVYQTKSMSSHADQNQLLEWLRAISGVKQVVLIHGDEDPRKALAERIQTELKIEKVALPSLNQELEL